MKNRNKNMLNKTLSELSARLHPDTVKSVWKFVQLIKQIEFYINDSRHRIREAMMIEIDTWDDLLIDLSGAINKKYADYGGILHENLDDSIRITFVHFDLEYIRGYDSSNQEHKYIRDYDSSNQTESKTRTESEFESEIEIEEPKLIIKKIGANIEKGAYVTAAGVVIVAAAATIYKLFK